ncbi:helix-turn-helix domain-containing protein [Lactobacillus helveticus]|uniref:Helix-turn-helix domain-containing protein n=1 Tax=Lactobacillus helveticus TaxID=1587 RepID=A0A6A7K0R6_LACHE|nr:helix-turn-helix transcriptional regulator [Lactobacillus helveticus]MPW14160.1 helix-turn-helix domain-containing protein [Lactobacillus helveticus]
MKDKLKQSIIAITSANLKIILYSQKVTQRDLAALTGISIPSINRYYLGNGAIPESNLIKIAKALHVAPNELDPSYQPTKDFLSQLAEKSSDPDLKFRTEYLKQLIQNSNLSVQELADKLSLKPITVYKWLAGVNTPSKENTAKLADLFNVSVDSLTDTSKELELTPQQKKILTALPSNLTDQQTDLIISLIKSVLTNTN